MINHKSNHFALKSEVWAIVHWMWTQQEKKSPTGCTVWKRKVKFSLKLNLEPYNKEVNQSSWNEGAHMLIGQSLKLQMRHDHPSEKKKKKKKESRSCICETLHTVYQDLLISFQ